RRQSSTGVARRRRREERLYYPWRQVMPGCTPAFAGISRQILTLVSTCMSAKRAVAHLAAYKLGAIALPLSTLFGQETLDYRLRDAGAWMEQLEHGLTPPFGSSYAAVRPRAARGGPL